MIAYMTFIFIVFGYLLPANTALSWICLIISALLSFLVGYASSIIFNYKSEEQKFKQEYLSCSGNQEIEDIKKPKRRKHGKS
jgi:hypothetical protein